MQTSLRLLRPLLIREWRETYAGSVLGGAWNLVQPLLIVLMYWWVFSAVWKMRLPASGVDGSELPFIVFLLSAMLPWMAFQESLVRGVSSVVSKADVLRHSPFPATLYPLSRVLAAHGTYVLVMIVAWAALWVAGMMPTSPWMLLVALLWLGLQALFALGLAWLLAALAVYLRDLIHAVAMVMTFLLFTAPILYPLSQVPEAWQAVVWMNPFTPFAEGFHAILLHGTMPSMLSVGLGFGFTALALVLGYSLFRKLQAGFVDVL
jgi:ABC-type polysaccharide/polyol phosphate export permease